MNGNKTTVLVIILGYFAGAAVFLGCFSHLRAIVRINRRIEERLRTTNIWLDGLTIKESFAKH